MAIDQKVKSTKERWIMQNRRNNWHLPVARQFASAIQMLRMAIEACPDDLWDLRDRGSPFWHLAYHGLFFTDFYLSENDKDFQPMPYHKDKAHFLPGDYQEFGGIVTTPEWAYTKAQLLAYADHCLEKCEAVFDRLGDAQLTERCGFEWYPLNMAEFLLNNLRHAQHHAGQLALLLRRHGDIGMDWLGTKDNKPLPLPSSDDAS